MRECLPNSWQVAIDNSRNAVLASCDIVLQSLPLAGKTLQGMGFRRSQVELVQPLRVDKRHLSQGESVNAVTLG
jgi:hypothetical protein